MTKQYWGDAMTTNCVWLFQEKQKEYPENGCTCDLYDSDGDLLEGKTKEDEDACQCYVEYWETSRVFLTREEAREYGKARPYAWGEEEKGWRIYGVPCDGIMTEILGKHNKEFKDKVEHITEEI
jgi:hypothetical protein